MLKTSYTYKQNTISHLELTRMQNKINEWEQKSNELQEKFNFPLPDYIVDEILESEKNKNFVNLHYLINCAVINNRMTEKNAIILKQTYKFN